MQIIAFLILFIVNSFIAIKKENILKNKEIIFFIIISLALSIIILTKSNSNFNIIINTIFASIVPLLIINTVIDIKTLELSKSITALIFLQGFMAILISLILGYTSISIFLSSILNSIALYIIYIAISYFTKGSMGGGDIKLIFALGIFFTLENVSKLVIYPLFIGTLAGIFLIIFKGYKKEDKFAFGPCIIATAYILFLI